jgi:hypothetical protein
MRVLRGRLKDLPGQQAYISTSRFFGLRVGRGQSHTLALQLLGWGDNDDDVASAHRIADGDFDRGDGASHI